MKSRERVKRALSRDGLPDRVPLQFDLSRPLLEAFSRKLDIPIGWQPNYYEDSQVPHLGQRDPRGAGQRLRDGRWGRADWLPAAADR